RRRRAVAAGEEGAPGRVQTLPEVAVELHRNGHLGREGPPALALQGEELVGAVAARPEGAGEILSQEVTPRTDRPVVLPGVERSELAARWAGGAVGAELGAPVDARPRGGAVRPPAPAGWAGRRCPPSARPPPAGGGCPRPP